MTALQAAATRTEQDRPRLIVRDLGEQSYVPLWDAMRNFTDSRGAQTPDELWLLTHPPVFTQGQAGRAEHLLAPGDIPVVQIDRGGQVTYHGPGQLIVYLLLDVRRLGIGARHLVDVIEQSIIECLQEFQIIAAARTKAPGVYVKDAKIAALGLRIRRGCSYHGLSLNVAMDLSPFGRINPCGYSGLQVTQVANHLSSAAAGVDAGELLARVKESLLQALIRRLGHTTIIRSQDKVQNPLCPTKRPSSLPRNPDAMC